MMLALALGIGYPPLALLTTRFAYAWRRARIIKSGIPPNTFDHGYTRYRYWGEVPYIESDRGAARFYATLMGILWPVTAVVITAVLVYRTIGFPLRGVAWLAFTNPHKSPTERRQERKAALAASQHRVAKLESALRAQGVDV